MAETPIGPKKPTNAACWNSSIWRIFLCMANTTGRRRNSRINTPNKINRQMGMTLLSRNDTHGHTAPNQRKTEMLSNMSIVGWRESSSVSRRNLDTHQSAYRRREGG